MKALARTTTAVLTALLLLLLGASPVLAQDAVEISVGSAAVEAGQSRVTVPVTAEAGFADVNGLQFRIDYDPSVVDFAGAGAYTLPGLQDVNFAEPAEGQMTFVWSSAYPEDVEDGQVMFEMTFDVVGPAGSQTALTIGEGYPTPARVYVNFERAPLEVSGGAVNVEAPGADDPVELNVGSVSVEEGAGQATVEVTAGAGFTDVSGLQFSLDYDPAVAAFASGSEGGPLGLIPANYADLEPGKLTFVRGLAQPVSAAEGEVLFELTFDVIGAGTSGLVMGDEPTPRRVYVNYARADLATTDGAITVQAAPNTPPTVANPGSQSSTEGEDVSLQIDASDPDEDDVLTYEASGLPVGLSINSATGLISGTVTEGAAGSYDVEVTVTDDGSPQESASTSFSWSMDPAPEAEISVPASADFGTVTENATGTRAVTVTNTGNADLVLQGASVSGVDAGTFSVTGTTTGTIAPNETQDVTVAFTPPQAGSFAATLDLASSAGPTSVALTGTGEAAPAPAIAVGPLSLDFGEVRAGQTSAAQNVLVENTGNADLNISALTLSGDDAFQLGASAPLTIPAGGSEEIPLTFAPGSAGGFAATLAIENNAGEAAEVALSGVGTAPKIAVSPEALTFGSIIEGTTEEQTVTVTNDGGAPLDLSGVSITGADAGVFSVLGDPTGTVAADGGMQDITVTFAPGQDGSFSAALALTSDAGSASVSLSGTASPEPEPGIAVSPSSLSFAARVGESASQSFEIENTGNAALEISGLSIAPGGGPFTITSGGESGTLGPDEVRQVEVAFAPESAGSFSATLSIASSAEDRDVSLLGEGQAQPPAGALPSPWASQDIGNPNAEGSAAFSDGAFTVEGSGSDIWGTSDEFRFVYQTLSGDGHVTARVASQTNTHPWAKAGVMIRASLAANSKHAMTVITPSNGVQLQHRAETGAPMQTTSGGAAEAPVWVRLERQGNALVGSRSNDGQAWEEIGRVTVAMGEAVFVGVPVTSHNGGQISTAVFDNVSVSGGGGQEPPVAEAVARINAGSESSYTDGEGNVWEADAYVTGGKLYSNPQAAPIAGTEDDELYVTEHSGASPFFQYAIPVPEPATYTVNLYFAEIYFGAEGGGPDGAGKRVFSVDVENGQAGFSNYDLNAEVGPATAVMRTFEAEVTDGTLNLDFTASVNQPKVSAIEVLSSAAGGGNEPPVARFTATPTSGEAPLDVQFDASTSSDPDGDGLTYTWSFGDGESGEGQAVSHTYASAGGYTATLTVADGHGGTAQTAATITAEEPPAPGDLPSPWASQDVGNPNAEGSAAFSDGAFTVEGSGSDIYGTSDEFRFVYQTLSGDGHVTARLASQTNTHPWAKAGVMIRASLAANSKHAMVVATPERGVSLQHRAETGGATAFTQGNSASAPTWVRLERQGNALVGSRSSDGQAWEEIGRVTVAMGEAVFVGVPVTSHNGGQISTAVFDNVSVSGGGGQEPPIVDGTIGEAGTVTVSQSGSGQWHAVSLEEDYANPVVVMGPATFNGGQPMTLRVRNAASDGFEFQIDEWDYLDGGHATETIGYLVVEAGRHTLPGGAVIEAGKATVSSSAQGISFAQAFAEAPTVVSQAMTTNDPSAVVTRQQAVSAGGFQLRLQGEEADENHGSEQVGWIAMSRGSGTAEGQLYAAGATPNAVTHNWYTLSYAQSFAQPPVVVAAMQTTDGGDPATLRMRQRGAASVQVRVEEEKSDDAETNHTTETVGYLAFAPGVISGEGGDVPPPASKLPWAEGFGGLADGAQSDDGATAWTTDNGAASFSVQNEAFQLQRVDAEAVWRSEPVEIAGAGPVNVQLKLRSEGSLNTGGPNADYVRVYYVLNGGGEELVQGFTGKINGNGSAATVSANGLSGQTVEIVVRAKVTGDDEVYFLDDVSIAKDEAPQASATLADDEASSATRGLPAAFELRGNAPNPFRHTTTLLMNLPARARITVDVFDVLGRRVLSLPARALPAGTDRALRLDGSTLAPGLYLYRVQARLSERTITKTGRMVLTK